MSRQWHARPALERWYTGMALADGRSPRLQKDRAILVRDGCVAEITSADAAPALNDPEIEVVDASGSCVVPSMVDCHAHLVLPGGARWIERALDPTEKLVEVSERTRSTLLDAGIRWIRDVGSSVRSDVPEGTSRALALHVRDRWRAGGAAPVALVAGGWLTAADVLPEGMAVVSRDGAELRRNAVAQLDAGADLVKLYLDGPKGTLTCPFSEAEVRAVTDAVHARGKQVAAHATNPHGVRTGVLGGVDTIEHGNCLDEQTADLMAAQDTALIPTISVYASFKTFSSTTSLPRFLDTDAQERLYASATRSVRLAKAAGVRIGAGSDFGGGSVRPGHLAWEGECLVAAGLEPWEALGALTWAGADIAGLPTAGRIEVGQPANFFFVHGDPTAEISALWRVWEVVVSEHEPALESKGTNAP